MYAITLYSPGPHARTHAAAAGALKMATTTFCSLRTSTSCSPSLTWRDGPASSPPVRAFSASAVTEPDADAGAFPRARGSGEQPSPSGGCPPLANGWRSWFTSELANPHVLAMHRPLRSAQSTPATPGCAALDTIARRRHETTRVSPLSGSVLASAAVFPTDVHSVQCFVQGALHGGGPPCVGASAGLLLRRHLRLNGLASRYAASVCRCTGVPTARVALQQPPAPNNAACNGAGFCSCVCRRSCSELVCAGFGQRSLQHVTLIHVTRGRARGVPISQVIYCHVRCAQGWGEDHVTNMSRDVAARVWGVRVRRHFSFVRSLRRWRRRGVVVGASPPPSP